MHVERLSVAEWDDVLPAGAGVFHQRPVLEVLDAHTEGDLTLYGGFKGDQPVALLPMFVRRFPFCRVAVSPPPGLGLPHLGPVFHHNGAKRRKREQVNQAFSEQVVADLNVLAPNAVFRMVCSPGYADPRPYEWEALELAPAFTYVLDADRPLDDILGQFSRSLRREIRQGADLDVTVQVEGLDAARTVFDETAARFAEQDEPFLPTWDYVRDLVSALDDRCRVYVARDASGAFLGGITVVYSDDTAYFWQGGTRATYENVSVNSLVHWAILEDIVTDESLADITRYDLMGANTKRLSRYKAKFGPELVPYYVVESNGLGMKFAKGLYHLVNGSRASTGLAK